MVTLQIAVSTALLIAAGLFTQSLLKVAQVELGVAVEQLASFGVSPQLNGYSDEQSMALFERIEDEVRAALATTLRIEPDTVGMEKSIINDLGATSIDFLDINFRLEQVFGIQLASQLLLDHVEEVCGEGTAIAIERV